MELKDKKDKFKFKCQKCNACCKEKVQRLFPWDIIRLCTKLKLNTSLFLEKYCNLTRDPESKMPMPLLKTDNGCRFLKKECTVYDARPFVCRMFPVGMKFQEGSKTFAYPIEECAGFNKEKEQSIEEYFKEQGLDEDLEMLEKWKHLLMRMRQKNYYGTDLDNVFTAIFYNYDHPGAIEMRKNANIEDKDEIKERFQQMLDLAKIKFDL
jgi:Fe-S-cluster containining protein